MKSGCAQQATEVDPFAWPLDWCAMPNDTSLSSFVVNSPWGRELGKAAVDRVLSTARERLVGKNSSVVVEGKPAEHWVGIISGFVVQSVTYEDGHTTFLSAVGDGAWFGEGTLLKHGAWGYDAVALRETRVAIVPISTFDWLHETSLAFNHFLLTLINDRLANFVGQAVGTRHGTTPERIARALAHLFNPALYSRPGGQIQISQSELAMLAGTTRQRTNQALKLLERDGLVEPLRQGIRVLDFARLRAIAHMH